MGDHGTRELGRTLPATGFGPRVGAVPPSRPAATATATAAEPAIPRHSLSSDQERRFAIGALLGAGATSQVYALEDRDLARSVAVKLLSTPGAKPDPDEVERFIEEARITASLSHPNVLPVHDIDVDERGRVFFTMTRVEGRSLGALIELSTADQRVGALADPNALVSVAIGVCQALAFAHRRSIVHQDIKPENVMLGEFGEVLVVDWGSARRGVIDQAHLYGTPLYMSPEQARGECSDARSDVYCFGATLFHALTLRLPTWDEDADAFWRAKRDGAIEPPTAAERDASPAPLLAIALKAMAPDPEQRYADASAMLDDLRRYQAGLAVSALRESPWRAFRRWHARHGRAFWSWSAAAAVVLALAALLWGKHLEEMARWGRPVVAERFDDTSWTSRWAVHAGGFMVRDGRLVSTTSGENVILLTRRLRGAMAIEYEGEILPGSPPCDISAVWVSDARFSADGRRCEAIENLHFFQVGAFDGAYTAIVRGSDDRLHYAHSELRPQPGRRYRVRVEIDENTMTMLIDGRVACSWSDPFRFSGGFLGIYGHYADKAFDDVRVYQREVPAKIPATATGDVVARMGHHAQAAAEYEQVAESHPGTALGDEARYKQGLCRWRLGELDAAEQAWRRLSTDGNARRIELHRAEQRAQQGDHAGALAVIERVHREGDAGERVDAANLWGRLAILCQEKDRSALTAYIDTYERELTNEGTIGAIAARMYEVLGRFEDVVRRFPSLRFYCVQSLNQLGRHMEIVEHYPDQRYSHNAALGEVGWYDRMDPELAPVQYGNALIMQGKTDECVTRYANGGYHFMALRALIAAGRFAEAEAMSRPEYVWERALLLTMSGRAEETAAMADPELSYIGLIALGRWREMLDAEGRPRDRWAACMAGIEAWIAGDRVAARRFFPSPDPPTANGRERFLMTCVLPFLAGTAGEGWEAFDASCAAELERGRWFHGQTSWHDVSFLLGRMDEATFLAQPARAVAPGRLVMLRAMRHERHGRRAEALADWRAWLALPLWRRFLDPDGAVDAFARWRERELGG